MSNNCIKRVIDNLKKKYNTACPYEISKSLGIILIIEPLGSIWGLYKYVKKNKVIYINSNLNEFQRRFVLAHELGHAILHPKLDCFFINGQNYSSKLIKEFEANKFASELLIDFASIDELYLQGYSINQLASYYEVPVELIEFKIKESKMT